MKYVVWTKSTEDGVLRYKNSFYVLFRFCFLNFRNAMQIFLSRNLLTFSIIVNIFLKNYSVLIHFMKKSTAKFEDYIYVVRYSITDWHDPIKLGSCHISNNLYYLNIFRVRRYQMEDSSLYFPKLPLEESLLQAAVISDLPV